MVNDYVVRASQCVFGIFWFQNFFLTFLVLMIPAWYINWRGFLATSQTIWRKELMFFWQFKRIRSQKTKMCFLNFLISKKNFWHFLFLRSQNAISAAVVFWLLWNYSKEWFKGWFGNSNEFAVRKPKCVVWIFWF